jgi:hypothetical protein
MKYILLTLLFLSSFTLKAETLFLSYDKKELSNIYYKFVVEVLESSLENELNFGSDQDLRKFKIMKKRYRDFYVAARKFQDQTKLNGFIIDLDFKKMKGNYLKFKTQMYNAQEKRIMLDETITCKEGELLTKLQEMIDHLSGTTGKLLSLQNKTGITNSRVLSSYLKVMDYKAKGQHDLYLEELEFLKNWFTRFPALQEMYEDEVARIKEVNKHNKNPFKLSSFHIVEDNQDFVTKGNNKDATETFVRELMLNGYRLKHLDEMIVAMDEDSVEFELKVMYDLKFTKLYQALHNKKLKENKVNNKYTAFGRYLFSNDEAAAKHFIDIIKKQALTLELLDNKGEVILSKDYFVSDNDFDSGRYRHATELPFPLTPQGSASTTYKIAKRSLVYFTFENLHKDDLAKVKQTRLRFKLME